MAVLKSLFKEKYNVLKHLNDHENIKMMSEEIYTKCLSLLNRVFVCHTLRLFLDVVVVHVSFGEVSLKLKKKSNSNKCDSLNFFFKSRRC